MRPGLAMLLMNMLASELGYKLSWIALPDGRMTDSFRLHNEQGDCCEFRSTKKYEQAVEWLRRRA
jgi:hypothetical protein